MGNDTGKELNDYRPQFGQIAITKGFITEEHLKKALTEQITNDFSNRLGPYKRLGEILFEKGWIKNKQIRIVLNEQHKTGLADKDREEKVSPEKKKEIAMSAGVILPGMTKREVRETFGSLQPRIWYTPREQEVWYYKIPQKQNVYFINDKVELVKYIH